MNLHYLKTKHLLKIVMINVCTLRFEQDLVAGLIAIEIWK